MEDRMIGTSEAARMLGVHPGTLRRWRRLKRGPAFHKYSRNGPAYYRLRDIEWWLENKKREVSG